MHHGLTMEYFQVVRTPETNLIPARESWRTTKPPNCRHIHAGPFIQLSFQPTFWIPLFLQKSGRHFRRIDRCSERPPVLVRRYDVERSCIRCRERKVRCDKAVPCSMCLRIKAPCRYPGPERVKCRSQRLSIRPRSCLGCSQHKQTVGG